MSTYQGKAIHPETKKVMGCWFIDDWFGRHQYGVQFDGDLHVYRQHEVVEMLQPDRESEDPEHRPPKQ